MHRIIVHVDMDAFFASVEQKMHPEWRGHPVVVGADPKGGKGRGVVAAASYEARKFGIHSAMPIQKAYALCPHAIFTRGHMALYEEISDRIFHILEGFTPLIEPVSIDEAFMDMSGCAHFYASLQEMGEKIKQAIYQSTGLTASVGIAPNKSLAKIASDRNKPDGLTIVLPHEVESFLSGLSVRKLWGVGERTAEVLENLGIRTCQDLWKIPRDALVAKFGKWGDHLYRISRGIDERPVETTDLVKSISNEHTFFSDVSDPEYIRQMLLYLSEKVAFRMKKYHLAARTVILKIRFEGFETHTRNMTVPDFVRNSSAIYQCVLKLLEEVELTKKIRLVGVGVTGLQSEKSGVQQSLFDLLEPGKEKIDLAISKVREKFGPESIQRAYALGLKRKGDTDEMDDPS